MEAVKISLLNYCLIMRVCERETIVHLGITLNLVYQKGIAWRIKKVASHPKCNTFSPKVNTFYPKCNTFLGFSSNF